MRIHTICKTHNFTALVGPGSLLDELECPTCIEIADGILPVPVPTDPEELFISRITRHANGNCCCESCDPSFCYTCGHYSNFCTCIRPVSLYRWTPKRRWGADVPF
jgi:hypothetical protein